ncbi:hypothetical protein OG909_17785 [Streptomyces sp. NBC_01754]|uniref:hypothetical protein n=1 Tax=Streptomyces sp. NBC_01754 TaxID=2975930 RepID=UPI002DDA977D|nr:hypothetical protein [Streptomyces sp. NBC_01754]WSC93972.1 hypothetical protein OG909_17785 [Streptomyces sp. NBC_01754]
MRATVVRRTALAASVVSLALLATACGGSDGGSKDDGGKAPAGKDGAANTAVKALTSAELEKASLEKGDVPGHQVSAAGPEDIAQPEDIVVDKTECKPIGYALYGAKRGTPVATTGRKVVQEPKKEGVKDAKDAKAALEAGLDVTSTLVALSSYEGDGAEKSLAELREAATACAAAGFSVAVKDSPQTITKVTEEEVSGGDEAVAWTVTIEEEGMKIPFKIVSVRQGGTVATFSSFNLGSMAGADIEFGLPSEVIAAQVKKLG